MLRTLSTPVVRSGAGRVPSAAFSVFNSIVAGGSQPPMDREADGVPPPAPLAAPDQGTQMTTLDNGLRIASSDSQGFVTSVALAVDAGSRYEDDYSAGTTALKQALSFHYTDSRSHLKWVREAEAAGATFNCSAPREHVLYTADVLRVEADKAVELLADAVLAPKLDAWHVAQRKEALVAALSAPADPLAAVVDAAHVAAFRDSGALGRSPQPAAWAVSALTGEDVKAWMDALYTPDRMVLSASGMPHDELVALGKKYFGGLPSGSGDVTKAGSSYFGGELREKTEGDLAHLFLGWDAGAGLSSADLMNYHVLQSLLGGGGAFSAGGPGKGMHSRLYSGPLASNPWIVNLRAESHLYSDAGIFGISGSAFAPQAGALVKVMMDEMAAIAAAPPSDESVERAKAMFTNSVYYNLEVPSVEVEDIARLTLLFGQREAPASLAERIAAVTPADISATAKKLMASKPTLAAVGNIATVPHVDDL